jgi:hypothetical protein
MFPKLVLVLKGKRFDEVITIKEKLHTTLPEFKTWDFSQQ